MDDFSNIVKSLEDSGVLLKGVSDTIQNKAKEQGVSKGVIRAGEEVIRAGYGSKRSSLKKF